MSRSVAALFAVPLSLLLTFAPLPGADAADPPLSLPKPVPKEIELETEVDLVKLLRSSMVFPTAAQLTDTIWQITPGEGRTIVRIPLAVSKPDTEVSISGAAVKVRGSRFICWQLIDPSEEVTGTTTPLPTGATIRGTGDDALPAGVPRLARSVRLDTDGKLHWKMDRAIPGATIVETTPGAYNLKLSRTLLETVDPGNPPRILKNAGESPADYVKRKQPLEAEYRAKAALFRETKQMLAKLPDEFSGPLPTTLWAIYETRSNAKTLELDGPAPLPWEFPTDLLQQLQAMNAAGVTAEAVTATAGAIEQELLKTVSAQKVHPYTVRLITHAITLSPFLNDMAEGDARYQIAAKILEAQDSSATAELMKYLAVRPSKASASLMQKALQAGLLDAKSQLGSVLGMVSTLANSNEASVESALQTINRYLADAKGPEASQILAPLFKLTRDKPALAPQIAKGLRVDATGARRDEVIMALLSAAVTDPVAMSAVDTRLLGSEDAALVERTLYLISRAERPKVDIAFTGTDGKAIDLAPAAGVAPQRIVLAFWSRNMPQAAQAMDNLSKLSAAYVAQGVRVIGINMDNDKAGFENFIKEQKLTLPQVWAEKGLESEYATRLAVTQVPDVIVTDAAGQILWRGRLPQLDKALAQSLEPGSTPATATDKDPRPLLLDDIGINSNDHAIFRLLGSAKYRSLAWSALRQMKMAPATAAASADRQKWTTSVVDQAITQSPTPVAAITFLSKHDEPGVAQGITQLHVRGDTDASVAASRALLGSGWPIAPILAGMGSELDRAAFGLRFYENIETVAPYAVNLLRDKSDTAGVVNWFGDQISAGTLPHRVQWAQPYEGEDRLLLLVGATDEQLAMGAIDVLVAGAGGSGQDTTEIATKLRANKNATIPDLTKIWSGLRKDLFTAKLKKASTNYNATLRLGAVSNKRDQWHSTQKVGKVAMKVEGPAVSINSATAAVPADDSLSITLSAKDLAKLDPSATGPLASLKVTADQSIALTPMGEQGWVATFTLPDSRRAQLMLVAQE